MDLKLRLVLPLVSKLASTSTDLQREGVRELRLLAKFDPENRTAIAKAGAIPLLLKLVSSTPDPKIQENAVTALLNLSISDPNKALIINEPAVMDVFVHSLTAGHTMATKENSAALVTSLMAVEEHRPLVGQSDGVIEALLDLLLNGLARGKKDALKALFYIATCAENRSMLIRTTGLIDMLTSLLMQRLSGLVEDSLAVLSQALACPESVEVVSGIPTISVIVDLLDTGTSRARENAASALLNFCMCGGPRAIEQVMDMKSCVSSLYSLLETGSSRGKGKASALLQILLVSC